MRYLYAYICPTFYLKHTLLIICRRLSICKKTIISHMKLARILHAGCHLSKSWKAHSTGIFQLNFAVILLSTKSWSQHATHIAYITQLFQHFKMGNHVNVWCKMGQPEDIGQRWYRCALKTFANFLESRLALDLDWVYTKSIIAFRY